MNFYLKKNTKSKPFPKNSLNIINNLRLYCLNKLLNSNSNQANKILQSLPLFYVLFRNFLTLTLDGNQNFLNDNLFLGKGYGSTFIKEFCNILGLSKFIDNKLQIHDNIYDTSQVEVNCTSLSFAAGLAFNQSIINKIMIKNAFLNKTYCVLGQEELSSSNFNEILNFVSKKEISNLVCIVDFTGFDQNGFISNHTIVDYQKWIESYGCKFLVINDGSNINLINKILNKAINYNQTVFIAIHNISGHGLTNASTISSFNAQINSQEFDLLKNRFDFEKPLDYFLNEYKEDLIFCLNLRITNRKKHYDSLIKNNKKFQDFLLLEKSEKQLDVFKKNYSFISTLLNENNLNLIFVLNTKIKIDSNLNKNNRLLSCNGSENIIFNIISVIKKCNFFNPILVTDLNSLNYFNQFLKNKKMFEYGFLIYVFDNLNLLSNYTYELNGLKINKIHNFFVHDIFTLNNEWNNLNFLNNWNLYFIDENTFNVDLWEKPIVKNNLNFDINIINYGASLEIVNKFISKLENWNIQFNLINILNTKKISEKLNLDTNKPLVLLNVDENHWINSYLLNIKNKKHIVKFTNEELDNFCINFKK
ncbi:hypothetical protein [Mycoplasmoides pirum]|uniref:hypothetical protein n=1 Tax=Mycoplasmoides pirum TaxID=2122 RepID=UPI000482674C|nr:hypothetical protein [Mycoplasmoides pirum]